MENPDLGFFATVRAWKGRGVGTDVEDSIRRVFALMTTAYPDTRFACCLFKNALFIRTLR